MKKILKILWDELVRGGFFTSICAITTLYSASIILNKPVRPIFAVLVFLFTIIIYFYNFIGEVDEDMRDDHREQREIKKYKNVYLFLIVISTILSIYIILMFGNLASKYFGVIFVVLGIFYTIGLKKLSKKIKNQDIEKQVAMKQPVI